jgi:hypothetical protein
MKTRSQTKKAEYEAKYLEKVPTDKYDVVIDFNAASEAWYANKKRLPHSMCKYICLGKTHVGKACNRSPLFSQNYCTVHLHCYQNDTT